MIYCILLNPTIDEIVYIPNFNPGGTYKITEQYRFPVGKSISVALTLKVLEIPVHVIALIGRPNIDEYTQFLLQKNISATLIPVEGLTRSNITIIDPQKNQSSHLRFPGFQISKKELDLLHMELERHISANDYAIFSGSLPQGCPIEYFFTASEIIHHKKAHIIIDTSGDPLINMLLYHPLLIKANLEEMGMILNKKLLDSQELTHTPNLEELYSIYDQCTELIRTEIKANIITLAQYGSIAFNRDQVYHAVLPLDYAPYTVGCGDSYLGGYIAGLVQNKSFEECIRLATACGAANTQTLGAGVLLKQNVDNFFPKVKITRLK